MPRYNCHADANFNAAKWFGNNNALCREDHGSFEERLQQLGGLGPDEEHRGFGHDEPDHLAPELERSNVIQFPDRRRLGWPPSTVSVGQPIPAIGQPVLVIGLRAALLPAGPAHDVAAGPLRGSGGKTRSWG